jgi:hypothetical protein
MKQNYYNKLIRKQVEEQINLAKEEKANIEDELSKILTQQLILKKRQADLGLYIEEAMKKVIVNIEHFSNTHNTKHTFFSYIFIHSFLIHSFTHSLIYSLIHSFTHSLTHSLTLFLCV